MLAYPFVAFFVLFPVGIFLGAVTNVAVVACHGDLTSASGCVLSCAIICAYMLQQNLSCSYVFAFWYIYDCCSSLECD